MVPVGSRGRKASRSRADWLSRSPSSSLGGWENTLPGPRPSGRGRAAAPAPLRTCLLIAQKPARSRRVGKGARGTLCPNHRRALRALERSRDTPGATDPAPPAAPPD